jgi:predicted amidohydrolase YtcJ
LRFAIGRRIYPKFNLSELQLFTFFCLIFGAVWCVAQGTDGSERLLFNAKVFTAVPEHPYAEAVAIKSDKIVAVGSLTDAAKAVSGGAEKIDLQGMFLLPGFIDSHCHAVKDGVALVGADFGDRPPSIDELVSLAREAKKSGRGMRGDVLYISGMPLEFWSHTDELNAHFNDAEFADTPVYLTGSDAHTGWGNHLLLKRAGINKNFIAGLPASDRGFYGLDKDGQPNGFGVDAGRDKLQAVVPPASKEQYLAGARAAIQYLYSLGITSWLEAWALEPVLATYKTLADQGELSGHVAGFWVVNPRNKPGDELGNFNRLRRRYQAPPHFTMPGIKVFADGVVEYPSQTAALSKPYKNSGRSGELLFDPPRFAELVTSADKQGLIVHVHAIGDRAVKEALNGIAAARKANGDSGLPHTITHVQFADPADFGRFKQLGVIAALQLLWATAEDDTIELVKPYIDPEIYQWQYPARSLLDAGATISGASDWFVSSPNVFQAIYQAETRKGPEGILDSSQRMPREAMLYAYTRNSAHALNQQNQIGALAAGMQADMVLVDRDLLTVSADELKDGRVLWTMVGGKTVYRAKQ